MKQCPKRQGTCRHKETSAVVISQHNTKRHAVDNVKSKIKLHSTVSCEKELHLL